MRTLSVTLTVSPLTTADPSTCIDTESTGGLAALGVQFKEKEVPVIRRAGLRGDRSCGGSVGRRQSIVLYDCTCRYATCLYITDTKYSCEIALHRMTTHTAHPE